MDASEVPGDWHVLGADIVHDLRIPLSALSGEVEVALRRERSPEVYREVLARIAGRIAELVQLTDDLALLVQAPDRRALCPTARLDEIVMALDSSDRRVGALRISAGEFRDTRVAGDEKLLSRAFVLIVDHAVRHRRDGAVVRLHARGIDGHDDMVAVILDASSGFQPRAWDALAAGTAAHSLERPPGLFPLRTAARILHEFSGALVAEPHDTSPSASPSVHIYLRRAPDGGALPALSR